MKKIVLTGGGTAGHVTPNIALIDRLKEEGFEVYYIGSKTGIEKEFVLLESSIVSGSSLLKNTWGPSTGMIGLWSSSSLQAVKAQPTARSIKLYFKILFMEIFIWGFITEV